MNLSVPPPLSRRTPSREMVHWIHLRPRSPILGYTACFAITSSAVNPCSIRLCGCVLCGLRVSTHVCALSETRPVFAGCSFAAFLRSFTALSYFPSVFVKAARVKICVCHFPLRIHQKNATKRSLCATYHPGSTCLTYDTQLHTFMLSTENKNP